MTGADIKEKRTRLGLTQKEFADALGLGREGQRTLRRWENGETTPRPLELKYIEQFPDDPPFPCNGTGRFRFIDLFAGIGGIRIPFQELGGKCVFTSEWDAAAQKTYRVNYGEEPFGDITAADIERDIPEHDVLLAGFPCQPFSQAGLGKGFDDIRGTMFFHIAKILEAKRPAAVLLENVKRFKTHDSGRTYQTVCNTMSDLGYSFGGEVLRAADFGVPQNRERIFMVGFRKDLLNNDGKDFQFSFPVPPCVPTRVGDILENGVDEKYTISDKLYQGHLRRKEEHARKGNGFGFSMFNAESPYTNTLSARYYKDGSEILIEQKGRNPRRLTPKECKRLQGFPEKFVIPVSDTQAYRQFGNSVSVPVVRAVAVKMLEVLEQHGIVEKDQIPIPVAC